MRSICKVFVYKIKELERELNLEKSSRRDLEMYVAVLSKQKDVFQTEVENIRHEHSECMYIAITPNAYPLESLLGVVLSIHYEAVSKKGLGFRNCRVHHC